MQSFAVVDFQQGSELNRERLKITLTEIRCEANLGSSRPPKNLDAPRPGPDKAFMVRYE